MCCQCYWYWETLSFSVLEWGEIVQKWQIVFVSPVLWLFFRATFLWLLNLQFSMLRYFSRAKGLFWEVKLAMSTIWSLPPPCLFEPPFTVNPKGIRHPLFVTRPFITLAEASVISQASFSFPPFVHSSHLCLNSNVAYILLMRSHSFAQICSYGFFPAWTFVVIEYKANLCLIL